MTHQMAIWIGWALCGIIGLWAGWYFEKLWQGVIVSIVAGQLVMFLAQYFFP